MDRVVRGFDVEERGWPVVVLGLAVVARETLVEVDADAVTSGGGATAMGAGVTGAGATGAGGGTGALARMTVGRIVDGASTGAADDEVAAG